MPYVHFTEEQKERANSVDLKDFLERQGERLIRSGREWRLESDHSITVRGNRWFDHGGVEKGGLAIDFVQHFYGKNFPDAVSMLLGGEQGEVYRQSKKEAEEPRKPFALPSANPDMKRVFAYLLKVRCLDREVVSAFARAGLIYESQERSEDGRKEYHNAIFVGRDKNGIARHAHKKGIYTNGKSYRGNIESSEPEYSFHWIGTSDILYVFEAPIDMLSYVSLHKEGWQLHSYVALCGVSHLPLWQLLKDYPHLKKIRLGLDHDNVGVDFMIRIKLRLLEIRYTEVEPVLSKWKDWNEDIKALHGQKAIPAEDTSAKEKILREQEVPETESQMHLA